MRAYTKVGKKVAEGKFGIQATLILSAMSETEPRSTPSITKAIVERLVTRQDPERVVAFYMTVWKKKGIVKQHDISEPIPPPQPEDTKVETAANVEETVTEEPEMSSAESAFHPETDTESEMPEATPAILPNLSGLKLCDAVVEVMKFRGRAVAAADVVTTLNENGYEFRLNQVQSALQSLQTKNTVVRSGDEFTLA